VSRLTHPVSGPTTFAHDLDKEEHEIGSLRIIESLLQGKRAPSVEESACPMAARARRRPGPLVNVPSISMSTRGAPRTGPIGGPARQHHTSACRRGRGAREVRKRTSHRQLKAHPILWCAVVLASALANCVALGGLNTNKPEEN
jgi:hypothetical protein